MLDLPALLAEELNLKHVQVQNALRLHAEGGTVPFIARYRKEATGEMDEVQLRNLFDRHTYLTELAERKQTVLKSIEEQGKLTPELREKVEACLRKTVLEDLYLPYKPKKRTRATVAREKGLEPLADFVKALNAPDAAAADLFAEAGKYLSEEKGVGSAEEALQGASDILAEEVSEKAALRAHLRTYFAEEGWFVSRVKDEFAEGTTKYEMYRDYRSRVQDIPPHNMLALRRGEREGVLAFDLEFDAAKVQAYLEEREIHASADTVRRFYRDMVKDAFERLMQHSLMGEVRLQKRKAADEASIKTFEVNLRNLLLASPAGMRPTLGIDPGLRTGCKVVALDGTGKLLENLTVYPHTGDARRREAAEMLKTLAERHGVELIAVGNGTGGRETDEFVKEVVTEAKIKATTVMVNESGASVYSASPVAGEEFPDKDVTVRGAVSIGRRLQDPLAELVKIDPKSIGVGQYQHDVDQSLLAKKLGETVESCVNYVGVDLNTASEQLLKHVSGLTSTQAKEIVKRRNEQGPFNSRRELLDVAKFGPKTFEQAAGFLRIRGGENPLDSTAVHPESYPVVERMATDLNVSLEDIARHADRFAKVELKQYVTEAVGEPTLRDILSELQKPGRDPRAEFRYAEFKEGVNAIADLATGMVLEGVVTNVAEFGAFVDLGVHQDGLVHVSQMANRFVKDPKEVVKAGQVVKVEVLDVNSDLKRISLSMKSQLPDAGRESKPRAPRQRGRGEGEREGEGRPKPQNRAEGRRRPQPQRSAVQDRRPQAQGHGERDRRPNQHGREEQASRPKPVEKTGGFTLEDLARKFNQGG
jgi:uncharacterized protein